MRPEWIAAVFAGVFLLNGAFRGELTDPGTWIAAIMTLAVIYVVFAFMSAKSGEDEDGEPVTRRQRLHGYAARYPWRTGFAGAAASFAFFMALGPLFDRGTRPRIGGWPPGPPRCSSWFTSAGYLYRRQQRGSMAG